MINWATGSPRPTAHLPSADDETIALCGEEIGNRKPRRFEQFDRCATCRRLSLRPETGYRGASESPKSSKIDAKSAPRFVRILGLALLTFNADAC